MVDSVKLNFRLRYVVLGLGVLFTLAVVGASWYLGGVTSFKDLAPIASSCIALTALIYVAMNFHLATSVRIEELRLKRLEYAMNFIEHSATSEMVKSIRAAADLRKETAGKNSQEVVSIIEGDREKTEALIMIFNYFERLGIVVRLGAADETALKDYYGSPVRRYWHSYQNWIGAKRSELQTNDLYSEFEKLADRWR